MEINERFVFNNEKIKDDELSSLLKRIERVNNKEPITFFEIAPIPIAITPIPKIAFDLLLARIDFMCNLIFYNNNYSLYLRITLLFGR